MRDSKAKSPLIIYIAETDHGDISYSSVAEKIIKECDAKGLRTSVFSEFGNKEKGLGSEDEKSLVGYFPQEQVNKFVNERCVPMGNVFNRFTKLIPAAEATFSEDITPSQTFDQRRSYVDNPETLKLLAAEITVRQQNQKEGIGEVGNQDSAGKNGADFKKFWGNANAFVQTTAHQEMAQDVARMISGQEDVVIMIAGAPHIYGLDKALGATFQNCEKLVVGNFQEFEVDLSNLESIENAKRLCGKKSCESVGSVLGFEVSIDKQAAVPDMVTKAISKQTEKEAFVERLDLKESEGQKKSWVERMRSDPTKGKSLGGSNEL
jgi:hypothetical protein